MTSLPDHPADLIRLALSDLRKVEKDPRYEVSMDSWHEPRGGTCHACLAGSVMAMSLNADIGEPLSPPSFLVSRKLSALDEFRTGSIEGGLDELGFKSPDTLPNWHYVCDYEDDPEAFHADMHKLADDLAAAIPGAQS